MKEFKNKDKYKKHRKRNILKAKRMCGIDKDLWKYSLLAKGKVDLVNQLLKY